MYYHNVSIAGDGLDCGYHAVSVDKLLCLIIMYRVLVGHQVAVRGNIRSGIQKAEFKYCLKFGVSSALYEGWLGDSFLSLHVQDQIIW